MSSNFLDLSNSGLSIQIDLQTGLLYFDNSIIPIKPEARMLSNASEYYQLNRIMDTDRPLYYMYRDVRKKEDASTISLSPYRFDITVILPGMIGKEFYKTIGHVHPITPFCSIPYTYTEVYSVIYGTAHYILQKYSEDLSKVIDIVDLVVNPFEHVLIPSFYGHVTVNSTDKPLVMANILYKDFVSNYEPYLKHRGAAIYLVKDGEKISQEFNTKYCNLPDPRNANAVNFQAPFLRFNESMYDQWIRNMNKFSYLYQSTE